MTTATLSTDKPSFSTVYDAKHRMIKGSKIELRMIFNRIKNNSYSSELKKTMDQKRASYLMSLIRDVIGPVETAHLIQEMNG